MRNAESWGKLTELSKNWQRPEVLESLIRNPKISPRALPRLSKMLKVLQQGKILAGLDPLYLKGCLMALYANSNRSEEMLFRIRHAMIVTHGNATKSAEMLRMNRADLWAFVEDYPEIFNDLLQKGTPNPHLLDHMQQRAEAETIARALEITKGERAGAAKILGIKRTTLVERIKQNPRIVDIDDRTS